MALGKWAAAAVSAMTPLRSARLLSGARHAARKRDLATAATLYAEFTKIKPRCAPVWVQFGHVLKDSGRLAEAEAAYLQAVSLAPHYADAYRQLGHLLSRLGQGPRAAAAFQCALCLAPEATDLREAVVSAGVVYEALDAVLLRAAIGLGTASVAECQQGRFVVPRLRVAVYLWMARRAARARRWTVAVRQYRRLVGVDANQPAAYVQLGHALKESGDVEGAVTAYRRGVAWSPLSAEVHHALGQGCAVQGNIAGAELAFLTALRLRPGHVPARDELLAMGWSPERLDQAVAETWSVPGRAIGLASRSGPEMPAGLSRREQILWKDLRGVVVGV